MADSPFDTSHEAGTAPSVWELMVEASSAAMVLVNSEAPDQPLVFVNRAFERMTEYSRSESIGRNCRFLQSREDRKLNRDRRQELASAVRQRRECSLILRNSRKSGEPFWNQLFIAPLTRQGAASKYFIGVQRDLLGREPPRFDRDLESLGVGAAHDLIGRIAALKANLEVVRDFFVSPDSTDLGRFIDASLRSTRHMHELMTRLLDDGRIRFSTPELTSVDLHRVAQEVIDRLGPLIDTSGATISVEHLPVVFGEGATLRRVLYCLVENALRYRRQDTCFIKISSSYRGRTACITVEDNGVGIAASRLGTLFQVHETPVGPAPDRSYGGFSLAICRRIVERHGGRIWAHSKPGQGSTFSFTIDRWQQPS